jgi:hypothetical protein
MHGIAHAAPWGTGHALGAVMATTMVSLSRNASPSVTLLDNVSHYIFFPHRLSRPQSRPVSNRLINLGLPATQIKTNAAG